MAGGFTVSGPPGVRARLARSTTLLTTTWFSTIVTGSPPHVLVTVVKCGIETSTCADVTPVMVPFTNSLAVMAVVVLALSVVTGHVTSVIATGSSDVMAEYSMRGFSTDLYSMRGYSIRGYSMRGLPSGSYSIRGYSMRGYSIRGYSIRGYSIRGYSMRGFWMPATGVTSGFTSPLE